MLRPGIVLPGITRWVVYGMYFLPILATSLVIVAVMGSFMIRRAHHAVLLVLVCNIALILQCIITWIALFQPLLSVLTTGADVGPS